MVTRCGVGGCSMFMRMFVGKFVEDPFAGLQDLAKSFSLNELIYI